MDVNIKSLMNRRGEHVNRNTMLDVIHEQIKPKRACEVGVQAGGFSRQILQKLPSLEQLYLVDLWAQQENYIDGANVADKTHEMFYRCVLNNTSEHKEKVIILKGYSTVVCDKIPDASLDWVYIDARHDYKGVFEDIKKYWPKIKSGGIMSGHDYLTSEEAKHMNPELGWEKCYDGSVEPRAVKGAVNDFATSLNKDVFVTCDPWPSWNIYK